MRGAHAWCLFGVMASGCLDVPAHNVPIDAPADAPTDAIVDASCGTPADCDEDGWPATSGNPAAHDCDDDDPAVNPGARDDPMTPADEDCIADGAGERLPEVSGTVASLTSGDLALGFDSPTAMPAYLRIGGLDALHRQAAGCEVRNEEGMGVSLYPAFAAHVRASAPDGDVTIERAGPAMATALVAWTATIPATGEPMCAGGETTLTANIRFTVLPGGRLIRDDRVNLSREVASCQGCPASGMPNPPIFTSYIALDGSFDLLTLDGNLEATFASQVPAPPQALPLAPEVTHAVCLRKSGDRGHIGVTWLAGAGGSAGLRLRTTPGDGRALVFDWRRSQTVAVGNHQATTTIVVDDVQGGPCSTEVVGAISEVRTRPEMQGLRYEPTLGVYEPVTTPTGALEFSAVGEIARGLTVRAAGFSAQGVTVWHQPGGTGAHARLVRDRGYLVQRDSDGRTVVHLPTVAGGDRITIAGPGDEPPP